VHLDRVAQREPGQRIGSLQHHEEVRAVGDDAAGGDFWFKSVEDAEAAGLTRAEKESDK